MVPPNDPRNTRVPVVAVLTIVLALLMVQLLVAPGWPVSVVPVVAEIRPVTDTGLTAVLVSVIPVV